MMDGTAQAGNTFFVRLAMIVGGIAAVASISGNAAGQAVLVDSTGKTAARALAESTVLVTDPPSGVAAPAPVRAIQGDDGRAASGLATLVGP